MIQHESTAKVRSLLLGFAALTIVPALLVACGATTEAGERSRDEEALDAIADITGDVEEHASATDPFVVDVLADGRVTDDERLEAAWKTVTCMTDQQVVVREIREDDTGGLYYKYGFVDPLEGGSVQTIYFDCYAQFEDQISTVHGLQNIPSEEEIIAAELAVFRCLVEAGAIEDQDFGEVQSLDDLRAVRLAILEPGEAVAVETRARCHGFEPP